jgi:hypothetical protein
MNLFAQNCVHCCRSATFSENERHFQGAGRGGKNAHEKKGLMKMRVTQFRKLTDYF